MLLRNQGCFKKGFVFNLGLPVTSCDIAECKIINVRKHYENTLANTFV